MNAIIRNILVTITVFFIFHNLLFSGENSDEPSIKIGMSQYEVVRYMGGHAQQQFKHHLDSQFHEKWVYKLDNLGTFYFNFINGILVSYHVEEKLKKKVTKFDYRGNKLDDSEVIMYEWIFNNELRITKTLPGGLTYKQVGERIEGNIRIKIMEAKIKK